jgi:hypothetical protein
MMLALPGSRRIVSQPWYEMLVFDL